MDTQHYGNKIEFVLDGKQEVLIAPSWGAPLSEKSALHLLSNRGINGVEQLRVTPVKSPRKV